MVDIFYLATAFAGGMALGLFHFGTLWLTVRGFSRARKPALLTVGSFFGRTAVTVVSFYLIMGGHWEKLLSCLFGFVLIRAFLVRRWRPERSK